MRKWTEKETAFLRKKYLSTSLDEIAKFLNRSYCSVEHEMRVLGLKKGYSGKKKIIRKWTKEEIDSLKTDFPSMSFEQLVSKYGRSIPSIKHKAVILGIKRGDESCKHDVWTNDEISYLKKNYDKNNDAIASGLNKSKRSVEYMRQAVKSKDTVKRKSSRNGGRTKKRLSSKDIDFIKENKDLDLKVISKVIKKPITIIRDYISSCPKNKNLASYKKTKNNDGKGKNKVTYEDTTDYKKIKNLELGRLRALEDECSLAAKSGDVRKYLSLEAERQNLMRKLESFRFSDDFDKCTDNYIETVKPAL